MDIGEIKKKLLRKNNLMKNKQKKKNIISGKDHFIIDVSANSVAIFKTHGLFKQKNKRFKIGK
jgi:hypothetical protein